jgi:NodT family efflux transporter outer membrane factor (OMF) lipoprotein
MNPPVFALLCAGTIALTGCAGTTAPALTADGGFAVPAAWSLDERGSASLASWWRGFGDALLVELVEAAQVANTDVRTAQANLRQARALRDEADAGLWPSIGASVSAQRIRPGSGNSFQAGFDASWEPDLFGATAHSVAAGEAAAQASAATLSSTQVTIAAEVAVDYLQLRGTQARAAYARENLRTQEETLQIARWREQAGLGTSLETSQAASAVEQTRAQLPLLEASIAQTRHALAVLTAQPPAALDARLGPDAPLPQPPADIAVAIPARTLLQRPDVLAAEWNLRAQAERVAQADAQRLPSIDLRASLAWSAATLGSLGSVAAARSIVASASQTLFDHGRRNAQLQAQQAAFEAAQESYRAKVLAALQDVEDALAALASSKQRVASLQAALLATRDAALLANNRYTSGLIDFQVVLDTQRTLLNVQDSVAGAQTDLATNHVRLYKALGGGWTPMPPVQEGKL